MILFTFAIIFIVLYLYYTINDVKRISNEIKKVSTDVQKLTLDFQGLNGSLNNLNLATNNLIIQKQSQGGAPVNSTVQLASKNNIQMKQALPTIVNQFNMNDDDDDDATSVNTEELKKIINENDCNEADDCNIKSDQVNESGNVDDDSDDDDEDDINDDLEIETVVEQPDLNKLKYEELKDLCKKKGISAKGTKDQLITRLNS